MSCYCDKCPFLSPKEDEQTDRKEAHFCSLMKRRIFHRDVHPHLPTPSDCPKSTLLEKYDEELVKMINRMREDGRYTDTHIIDTLMTMFEMLSPGFPNEDC